ncbi:hypothetical protein ABFS82_13G031300 [Erythranthe guttata]
MEISINRANNQLKIQQNPIINNENMKKTAADHQSQDHDLFGGGGAPDQEDKRKRAASGGGATNTKKSSGGGGASSTMKSCQAEKCSADLSDAKTYHRRHKVCEHHAKAQVVVVAGIRQRFCQQCSRFHDILEFDESKRSCRRRLAGHNERRRKNPADSYSQGAAEGGGSSSSTTTTSRIKGGSSNTSSGHVQENANNYNKHFHIR